MSGLKPHASIDIGSNTLRMLIARPATQPDATEPWEVIEYAYQITRLGQGLHDSGYLSDAGMERSIQAIAAFQSMISQHKISPENTFAVATAAVREAGNGSVFVQQVLEKTGINISVIDGNDEAAASLLGASAVLKPETSYDMLLFDIGGGSTEFIRIRDNSLVDSISCKLGVVRLVEAHLHSDPPSEADYQSMKRTACEYLEQVNTHWLKSSSHIPVSLVGTAGTVTTLAAIQMNLYPYKPQKINNYRMTKEAFHKLKMQLLALDHKQRENIPAIEEGRADLIVAGLAIIESIMEKWAYTSFVSVDAGLLEGNWLASY